jgi:hypothetical protein
MAKRPLFSSYAQGENRVTGSMVAVFERLDLATLERILGAASEESSLQLVTFDLVRPEGTGTVPDARIAASFKYLFEVKTAYESLRGSQLSGHLAHLDGAQWGDQRLFVITPDPEEPDAVSAIGDERVRWFNFERLNAAINRALSEDEIPDDERFLLRELQALFAQEGLLGRHDVVIVAAGKAYDFFLRHSAYVCQRGRAFRRGLKRLGFYRSLKIERELPGIIEQRDDVVFSPRSVAELRASGLENDVALAQVIESSLDTGERIRDQSYQVFLLTGPADERTHRLPQPIRHEGQVAWTMGQRYAYFDDLAEAPETTAGLEAAADSLPNS